MTSILWSGDAHPSAHDVAESGAHGLERRPRCDARPASPDLRRRPRAGPRRRAGGPRPVAHAHGPAAAGPCLEWDPCTMPLAHGRPGCHSFVMMARPPAAGCRMPHTASTILCELRRCLLKMRLPQLLQLIPVLVGPKISVLPHMAHLYSTSPLAMCNPREPPTRPPFLNPDGARHGVERATARVRRHWPPTRARHAGGRSFRRSAGPPCAAGRPRRSCA